MNVFLRWSSTAASWGQLVHGVTKHIFLLWSVQVDLARSHRGVDFRERASAYHSVFRIQAIIYNKNEGDKWVNLLNAENASKFSWWLSMQCILYYTTCTLTEQILKYNIIRRSVTLLNPLNLHFKNVVSDSQMQKIL